MTILLKCSVIQHCTTVLLCF